MSILSGAASNIGNELVLCTAANSGGGFVLDADLAPNFQISHQVRVPNWNNGGFRIEVADHALRFFNSNTLHVLSNNVVSQIYGLSNPLSNNAWNDINIINVQSNLIVGVNGHGVTATIPRWIDGSLKFFGSNAGVTGSNAVRSLYLQSMVSVNDPTRFENGVVFADSVNGPRAGFGEIRSGDLTVTNSRHSNAWVTNMFCSNLSYSNVTLNSNVNLSNLTASNVISQGTSFVNSFANNATVCNIQVLNNYTGINMAGCNASFINLSASNATFNNLNFPNLSVSNLTASNLGNAAFCNVIPISMVSGSPGVTSNFGVLTASNLTASNLGAAAFCNVIPISMVSGSPGVTSNFASLTATTGTFQTLSSSNLTVRGGAGVAVPPTVIALNSTSAANTTSILQFVNNAHCIACTDSNSFSNVARVTAAGHNIYYQSAGHNFSGQAWFTSNVGIGVAPAFQFDVAGTARFRTNVICSNVSACNLGNAAFCNVIPFGMVTDAPVTSNYGVLTASNLSASNLGAAAFCNVIPFGMVSEFSSNFDAVITNRLRYNDIIHAGNRIQNCLLSFWSETQPPASNHTNFYGFGLNSGGRLRYNVPQFGSHGWFVDSNQLMVLDENGRLGIGTTPAVPLDVAGTIRATSLGVGIVPDGALDVNGLLRFRNVLFGNNQVANCIVSLYSDVAPSSNVTEFYGFGVNPSTLRYQAPTSMSHAWFNGGTQRMVLTGAGRLGIGNPNPTQLLDVNGNVRIGNQTGTPITIQLNSTGAANTTGKIDFVNGDHYIACTDTANFNGIGTFGSAGHKIYYKSGEHAFQGPVNVTGQFRTTTNATVNGHLTLFGGATFCSEMRGFHSGRATVPTSGAVSTDVTVTHNQGIVAPFQHISCVAVDTTTPAVNDSFAFKILTYSANSFVVRIVRCDLGGTGSWNRSWTMSWTIHGIN